MVDDKRLDFHMSPHTFRVFFPATVINNNNIFVVEIRFYDDSFI